jgi:hypothetical protein
MTFNFYKRLRSILPEPRLLIGTVLSVDTTSARVELPDGSVVHARGEATAGQKVYLRNGVIEGPAPDLPVVNIEI